ncbi:hypothetical protein NFI96_009160 [Prochilodus magdalenae]|nr:hypothetical protein NFI96_009160 [Prochilodus magdalenae]
MIMYMYIILFSLTPVAVLGVTVEQSELLWTMPAGKKVYISCKVTGLTTGYVHWYQQKDGEALKRILYTRQDGSGLTHDPNHKEAKDFTVKEHFKHVYPDGSTLFQDDSDYMCMTRGVTTWFDEYYKSCES